MSRVILLCAFALLATACSQPVEEETRHRFTAMGTLVDVNIWGVPPVEAEAAAKELEALFVALHAAWDPWGDGALGAVNRALAAGEPITPDPDLAQLLDEAAALTESTDGLFDPAIGSLVRLWGFSNDEARPSAPPPADEIAARLAATVPLPEMLVDGVVRGPAGVQLDLGGFLKGVAVNRGIELLQARGIEHAIVNAGGDLRAIGRRGERPWRIGIRAARDNSIVAALEVEDDEAVFTSGDYERYFDYQGRHYHHILDPRTGYPTRGIASVTVVHGDAALADAAATALLVAGPEEWPGMAATLGLDRVLVVFEDGDIELTEALRPRAWFTDEEQGRRARVRPLP